jgi:hypothetical protein
MSMSKSLFINAVISDAFGFAAILSGLIMLACAGSAIHFAVFDIKPILAMRAIGLSLLFGLLSFSAGLNASYYDHKAINNSRFKFVQYWDVARAVEEKIGNLILSMAILVAIPGAIFCAYYLITSSFEPRLAVGMIVLLGAARGLFAAISKLTQEKRSQIG